MVKLEKNILLYLLCVAFIYVSFSCIYVYYLASLFDYQGFTSEFSQSRSIFTFFFVLLIFYISHKIALTSFFKRLVTELILFFLVIPTMVMWNHNSITFKYFAIIIFISVSFIFLMKFRVVSYGVSTSLTKNQIKFISATLILISLTLLIIFQGVTNFNLDYADLYDFRSTRISLPFLIEFLIAISTQLLLPIVLLVVYQEKKIFYISSIFLIYFLFFLYTNQKTFLFTPFLLLAFFLLLGRGFKHPVFYITFFVSIISFFEIVVLFVNYNFPPFFSESTVRRLYFIPNLINNFYVEYFNLNEYYYWSDSKISMGLSQSQSDVDMPHAVGRYFLNPNSNANTGFVGSGFGQMGIIGVVIYFLVFTLTVILIDSRLRNVSSYFVVALFFMPIYTLITSSDLPSIYLSNGLGLSIIMLFLLKKQFINQNY